jgi:hypothetical protein
MPLIPQQDVLVVPYFKGGLDGAVKKLRKDLEDYPPCRIVSIAMQTSGGLTAELVVVIETT